MADRLFHAVVEIAVLTGLFQILPKRLSTAATVDVETSGNPTARVNVIPDRTTGRNRDMDGSFDRKLVRGDGDRQGRAVDGLQRGPDPGRGVRGLRTLPRSQRTGMLRRSRFDRFRVPLHPRGAGQTGQDRLTAAEIDFGHVIDPSEPVEEPFEEHSFVRRQRQAEAGEGLLLRLQPADLRDHRFLVSVHTAYPVFSSLSGARNPVNRPCG